MLFLYHLINSIFQALIFLIIIRTILSWIPHDSYHPLIRFIYSITDPILSPFQNIIPTRQFGMDFSPVIAIIVLGLVQQLIINLFS